MRKLILAFFVALGLGACSEQEPDLYSGRQLEYDLYKASDFDYNGTLTVKEMRDGKLEFDIQLEGVKSSSSYSFPAHLHFGAYDEADSPIAFLLNPVTSQDLGSNTVLGTLSDGTTLDFGQMQSFEGHVKIHLASEGPDYEVILVAGNIGTNTYGEFGFDASRVAVCGKGF